MGNRAKHTRVLAGGYALTTSTQNITFSITADDLEDSAYEQDHSHMKGQFESEIKIDGYFDGESGNFHTAMKNIADDALVTSIFLGENASPAAGDITFNQSTQQTNYELTPPKNGIMTASGTLMAKGGSVGEFGVLLMDETVTGATNGTTVDEGASSSNGGVAYFHVNDSDLSETVALKVQDSPDGGSWADLVSSTLDGSAVGAERVTVSGSVDRYVRGVATPTGASFPVAISFVRK